MKITDDQNEIFDVVDENDLVVGQAKRGEVHGNPLLIHRSVGVLVFNSSGELFLQQRSATKDTDPLKWTISCSGHVSSGSSTIGGVMASTSFQPATPEVSLSHYEKTAHRELIEELGVDLKIKPVTKYLWRSKIESEMVMLFQAESDGTFKLHPQEIKEGRFFTRKELIESVKSGKIILNNWAKVALEKAGWILA